MSAPKSSELTIGYRVEQAAGNGGWVLYDWPADRDQVSVVIGAFSNADDLIKELKIEHRCIDDARAARIAKERAEKLGLEEQVKLPEAGAPAPIGKYRMEAVPFTISAQQRVPDYKHVLCNEVHEDVEAARRAAILMCERGHFAFVYNDQGEVVMQVAP